MPVPTERFSANELAQNRVALRLSGVRRNSMGAWVAELEVEGDVALPDGRVIDVRRSVVARMNQQHGRRNGRGNPAAVPAR